MNDELIAAAEIGEQARLFLEGDLGRILVGLAQQEVDLALEGLGDVEPTDTDSIRKLQNKVVVGRWFKEWLNGLVADGDEAMRVFKQQQETA